jgi:hypothetical protein
VPWQLPIPIVKDALLAEVVIRDVRNWFLQKPVRSWLLSCPTRWQDASVSQSHPHHEMAPLSLPLSPVISTSSSSGSGSQVIDCFPLSQVEVGSFCFSAPVRRAGCGGLLVSTDCVRR